MAANDPAIALAHWRAVREQPLPRASAVARPDRASEPLPGRSTSTPTRACASRSRRARPAAGTRRLRPRAAQQRRRHARLQPHRPGHHPVRVGRASAVGVLDGRLRGRPVHPVPRRHQRHRDLRGRPLPGRAAKSADLGGDPADGHADPRFQLRVPAVVRLRSALGVPPGAAGEPPRHRRSGRANASPDAGARRAVRTDHPERDRRVPRTRRDGRIMRPCGSSRRLGECGNERLLWSRDIRFVHRVAARVHERARSSTSRPGMVLIGPADELTESLANDIARGGQHGPSTASSRSTTRSPSAIAT